MKILIAGATGFIGSELVEFWKKKGHELHILSRSVGRPEPGVLFHQWNPARGVMPEGVVAGVDAVINLAGAPISRLPWTASRKKEVLDSRILSTRLLGEAIRSESPKPIFWLNGSAIGIYGDRGEQVLTETSEVAPHGFLAEVCRDWEKEASRFDLPQVRQVILRIGMVLGAGGGALPAMKTPFQYGVGAILGSGKQWMSWIHVSDLVRMIDFCLNQSEVSGPINGVSPHPVPNEEFSEELARALGRPRFLKAPAFVLRALMQDASQIVLSSQRVLPQKVQNEQFEFEFRDLKKALRNILKSNS